ncbi:MAG TPA: class I SAM-dependent methyltransferase [Aridibacter sp.]|nr:class I SAM-dependent methyltransferase [Aridibacter sp.]
MTEGFDPEFVHQFEYETWTRCAPDYLDGFSGLTRETLPMLIEAAEIEKGFHVLDVGSGPGHICGTLVDMGCSATGIDFSGAMVEIAREEYPGASFYEGNAEEMPFDDVAFDSSISNFVVHHLARPEEVFSEVARVLKNKGRLACAVFADPESQSSPGAFFAAVEEHYSVDELPHGPLFGVTDLDIHRKMLEAGGFSDTSFEFKPVSWRSEAAETVFSSFAVWANLQALPEDVRDKIRESTLKNYEAFKTNDGYEFPHEALIASASK